MDPSFYILSVSLCLFIDKLSSLILRDINDQYLLIPLIFGFGCGGCVCVSFLGFAAVRLHIACVFMGTVNFIGLEFSF